MEQLPLLNFLKIRLFNSRGNFRIARGHLQKPVQRRRFGPVDISISINLLPLDRTSRELDRDHGPFSLSAANVYRPVMVTDYLVHDGQAESGPSRGRIGKRLEQTFDLLRRHSASGIGKNYPNSMFCNSLDRDGELSAIRHSFYGISSQVPEDLL